MTDQNSSGNVTGYGLPSMRNRLVYNGDESKFELWLEKFRGHLRLQKLLIELDKDVPDVEKNACIYAELVMLLDDKSLSLVIRDGKDDGKKSLAILVEHYLGKSKPRIISLYGELASMKMLPNESVTDYIIRGETAATSLKTAGEIISDSLLVAMCLKGLPSSYNSFATVIAQKDDKMDFIKFKCALRSFEETENSRNKMTIDDNVMNMQSSKSSNQITCYKCGKTGHRQFECRSNGNGNFRSNRGKSSRYCTVCKNGSHDTKFCRSNSAKSMKVDDNDHSFAFKTVVMNCDDSVMKINNSLLVDCGATSHIVCDKNRFECFDQDFVAKSHFIELADGSRSNNVVHARGKATMHVLDSEGKQREISLQNALYIPSYSQNIFSVHAATENGASVTFTQNDAQLRACNGTTFDLVKRGRLYYLYNVNVKSSTIVSKSLRDWHITLGHCNVHDILKMEARVQGMATTEKQSSTNVCCGVCLKGKMVGTISQ